MAMTNLMNLIAERMSLWTILLIAAAATIAGDLFAKYWSLNRRPALLAIALAAYFLGSVFYIPSLLRDGLVITSTIWSLVSTLGFILLGLLLFREHLSFWQGVGVGLGALALIVFAFAEK
jgi:multidrug transporter EmrE-like cation transporter